MKHRPWIKFNPCFILVLLVNWILLNSNLTHACGGGDDPECWDGACFSIFSPEIINQEECRPFFFSQNSFYFNQQNHIEESIKDLQQLNIAEWKLYLKQNLTELQLDELINKIDLKKLDQLIFALKGQKLPSTADENLKKLDQSLQKIENSNLVVDSLYYLGFAKRAEKYVNTDWNFDPWDNTEQSEQTIANTKDIAAIDQLIAAGKKQSQKISAPFLKQRYTFQILRLYFYSKRYSQAIQFYDDHKADLSPLSSIYYRSLEIKAGSLYKEKKYAPANFLFAEIFDQYPPLRKRALVNFHPQNNDDWQATISLAKNPAEKEALWTLFGIYADSVEAIRQIYSFNPKSKRLVLLLVREVNHQESKFDWEYTPSLPTASPPPLQFTLSDGDLNSLEKISESTQILQPYVWYLSLGQLWALKGDTIKAEKYFSKVQSLKLTQALILDQLRISRFFNRLRAQTQIEKKNEDLIAKELLWLKEMKLQFPERRGKRLLEWAEKYLSTIYGKGGDWIRSLMLMDHPQDPVYQNNVKLDQLMAFKKIENPNLFDSYLIKKYDYSFVDLTELKALNELYQGNFEVANKLISDLQFKKEEKLQGDPFLIHIKDCHDCDFEVPKSKTYTKKEFIAEINRQFQAVNRKEGNLSELSFRLANGLYNMTYYGNARAIYYTPHSNYPENSPMLLRMDLAEKYYRLALASSSDPEFRAKMTFMLAKTEQNKYFSGLPDTMAEVPIKSGEFFRILKNQFAKTKYYQEIIQECGYFKTFLNQYLR